MCKKMEFLRRKLAKKSGIQYINKIQIIILLFISISRNYFSLFLLWNNGLQYIIALVIILLFSKNDNEIVTLFVNPLWGAKSKRVLYKKPFFHLTVKKEKSLNLCSRYFFTLLNARRGFWHTLWRTTCKLQKTQVNFSLKMGACMQIIDMYQNQNDNTQMCWNLMYTIASRYICIYILGQKNEKSIKG